MMLRLITNYTRTFFIVLVIYLPLVVLAAESPVAPREQMTSTINTVAGKRIVEEQPSNKHALPGMEPDDQCIRMCEALPEDESLKADNNQPFPPKYSVKDQEQQSVIEPSGTLLVDTIKVVIYSEDGMDIIMKSDIERPSIDGTFKSLDDLILERLMYMEAKRFKILPDEESVDKHLKAVQRENNLTLDQLKAIFKAAGYTYEEGREQFAMMTTINSLLDFKIRSRLIVPEREVVAYYQAHKEIEPAAYFIERAVVPYPKLEKRRPEIKHKLEEYASTGQGYDGIEWSMPFWITKQDMAEDKLPIITALVQGQVSMPIEIEDGYELFRLVNKKDERVKTLEESYRDISNVLRKPRYDALMDEYKKQLFDNASIVYL